MKIDLCNINIKDLAIIVSSEFEKNNISAVLVGDACVSIYSCNEYLSMDLNYITYTTIEELKPVMSSLGFFKKSSRHFEHQECRFFIEFPPPPIAIGYEFPINRFHRIKSLKMLTPTDSVKDRLTAYYNWNDQQSLDQALMIVKKQEVNLKEVKEWSEGERSLEKFNRFKSLLTKTKKITRKINSQK